MATPSKNAAVEALEPLVGEWSMEATPPGGPPWPGGGRVSFEWMEGAPFLIERSHVDMGGVPDSICVIGCDASKGTYFQLYSDDRDVQRIYEMSLADGGWRLWRDAEDPFPQRYIGRFSEDGKRIEGRWEKSPDGSSWETDFELNYIRVE
jgi:hypothetical protein